MKAEQPTKGPSPPGDGPGTGIPDLKWANKNLPMRDVAAKLDLRQGASGMIHCWHPERHKNGDSTPSVGIQAGFNTAKCFGCDSKPQSVVDVVRDVLGCDLSAAIAWLDSNFIIPRIPKRKHLESDRLVRPYRVGTEDPITLLVRSGIWAALSVPARCIVPVLLAHAEHAAGQRDAYTLQMSYRAIMTYSGLKSFSAVSKALGELTAFDWVTRKAATPKPGAVLRATGTYILTPYSEGVQETARTLFQAKRQIIEAERELRRVQRNERMAELREQSFPASKSRGSASVLLSMNLSTPRIAWDESTVFLP